MASRLQDVILRDTRANQPLATDVAPGTLYYVTDELVTERSDGIIWEDYSDSGGVAGISQLTGDVTAGPGSGSQAATIGANKVITTMILNANVTYAKIQNVANDRILGRDTAGAGVVEELAVSGGVEFTGTGIQRSALTGDVTAAAGSNATTIANLAVTTGKVADDAITYPKIQNVSATDRLLGRDTAAAGDIEEIPVSSGLEFTGGPGLRVTVPVRTMQIGITVDGGASVVTTGVKGYKSCPVTGVITGVRLLANAAGNVVFDIQKSTFAGFPPTVSIVASAPPTLTGAQSGEDVTLTGWTTAVTAGDVFEFNITGTPTVITRVTLELTIVIT